MKKVTQTFFFLLLLVSLLLPSNTALSQDGDLSDLLVSTIWQLHLREGLGLNSVDGLIAFRDQTQLLFDDAIAAFHPDSAYVPGGVEDDEKDPFNAIPLKMERANILEDLNERIALAMKKEQKAKDDTHARNVLFVIHAVLMDGADSVNENVPEEPNPVIDRILPVLQEQTKKNTADMFYGHIASQIPDSGDVVIFNISSQMYNIDAGLPPSSASSVTSQGDAENNGNGSGGAITIQKPLQFANGGLYDATVRVFSYTPADGVRAGMSGASTVVFRGSNPSANLSLPIGTYVFCYDWDLGTDADKDGYVDYAHKNTGSVTLTAESTDNINSAQVVTLDPGNNQNGKCGETASSASGDTANLTPQELANQGTHIYAMNCVCNGAAALECDFWGGDWDPFAATINFVKGGVNLTDEDGATYFQAKLGVNTYDYGDSMVNGVLTFTDVGMVYSGEGLICTAIRR